MDDRTLGDVKWRPSPFFNVIPNRVVRAIVIHTAECPEIATADDGVGNWFRNPGARVSAHYIVDADSAVQSVLVEHVAWHAGPVNDWTVGIELAGSARQTEAQWHDDYSLAVLRNAAAFTAVLCERFAIPVRRTPLELVRARGSGVYGHCDVSEAFPGSGGHFDPGTGFCWDEFLSLVRSMVTPIVT